jgi:hypothetical protein
MKGSTKNKYLGHAKYVVLAVIIITITGFFLFLFDKPSLNFTKKKKNKQHKQKL